MCIRDRYLSSGEYLDDGGGAADAVGGGDVTGTEAGGGNATFRLVAGNALDTFNVDADSGALVIVGTVDYERCTRYSLVARMLSGVGHCVAELNVDVVVVNVDDNPPQFDADLTYIAVRVGTPVGAAVYAAAADDADGSRLLYALGAERSSVGVASWLGVDDVTGHVVVTRPLTDAPRLMDVVVTATDVGRHVTSMTLVVTVVKDAAASGCGRGRGLAVDRKQRVAVVEDAEMGSVVASVETDDVIITSFCNSTPVYSLLSGNDFDKFVVDRFTGE